MPNQPEKIAFNADFLTALRELMVKYYVKSITPMSVDTLNSGEVSRIAILDDGRLSITGMIIDNFEKPMSKDDALRVLSLHLMQCGSLMPMDWIQKNGDGSEFMTAYEMAMEALNHTP